MTDVYLAVGHGLRKDGVFDPGARGDDGRYEHFEATEVVSEAVEALQRSGVTLVHEAHGSGGPEDPNYAGSIDRVNAGSFRMAVEVHFDWAKAPDGGFGHWYSDAGKRIADAVMGRWTELGLPTRPSWHKYRSDLSFLKRTRCPAMLWECGRVQDWPAEDNARMGEAIAAGICDALGMHYVAPSLGRRHYAVTVMGLGDLDEILAYQLGKRHAFKVVSSRADESPFVKIEDIDTDYVVAVGGAAARRRKELGLGGVDLNGETRYETADIVLARVMGADADRRAPFA